MAKKILSHLLILAVLAGVGVFFLHHTDDLIGDPDRYYHFALSKQIVQGHELVPSTIPAVVGLHWDRFFPDKEFFFHQLTALGYRFGGENGVTNIILLFAFGIAIIGYITALEYTTPLLAAGAVFCLVFSSYFLYRITLLRPHVVSIFFFGCLLLSLIKRQRILAFLAALLMTLSYHAVFVPLILIGSAAVVFFFLPENKKQERDIIVWSLGGIVIGIFVNPYFPANLIFTYQIAQIPSLMQGELSGANFGTELYPIRTLEFRQFFLAPLVIFLASLFAVARSTEKNKKLRQDLYFIGLAAAAFLFLSLESPRATEYLIPSCIALVAILSQFWEGNYKKIAYLVVLALCISPCKLFYELYKAPTFEANKNDRDSMFHSVNSIPKNTAGELVFNCNWDNTPYLYYLRPDLKFLDILDPSLLYFNDKAMFNARQSMLKSEVADPYGLIHDAFKARFVFCAYGNVINQLQHDPDFFQLFPTQAAADRKYANAPTVFSLREKPIDLFLKKYSLSFLDNASIDDFRRKTPADAKKWTDLPAISKGTYLNLFPILKEQLEREKAQPKTDANCAVVKTDPQEIQKYVGAEYLAIGGGKNLRIWRNGKAFYNAEYAFPSLRRIDMFVPIPGGLRKNDSFEVIACSSAGSFFFGVSLSFWQKKTIDAVCAEKLSYLHPEKLDDLSWQYSGSNTNNCMGPYAPLREKKQQ